jgi:preprotein translocase subunit SecA
MTAVPSATWRMLRQGTSSKRLPKSLDALWDAGAGAIVRLTPRLGRCMRRAMAVVALEKEFAARSDAALREETEAVRALFRRERQTPPHIIRAFAIVREAARRQLGLVPFPVQLAGAFALEDGAIAEMATGEGKTLSATLPATTAGWRGRGCHVITVNDYLARRDARWMSPLYRFCGLTVAHVEQEMTPPQRRQAYTADITYCTNKEVTADFLRDRLALRGVGGLTPVLLAGMLWGGSRGVDRLVQRGLECAIVDEADSVLIDEAVTPLIISGDAPNQEQVEAFRQAADLASKLTEKADFRVNNRFREVDLTADGKRRAEELSRELGGLWAAARRREELVVQALTARLLYQRDKQYIVDKEKVVIVDEFTGRLMPDREWRDGLHQAVQARESLPVEPPKDTYARISFQRFFRLYRRLSGMTGTAKEGWSEFWQIYHRPVVVIPTNRPCRRQMLPDAVYATQEAKWRAIAAETQRLHKIGAPVLVGTRSVRDSEHLNDLLRSRGLEPQVLNAVRHAEEAAVVARAGQPGAITVATNMAGRGTDIVLGRGMAELGGLHVIASERHESGRVDRQLFGRCARQGDPGVAQAIVSLEDELVARHAPRWTALIKKRSGHADRPITSRSTGLLFAHAQSKAQRLALSHRKGVLNTDDWLDDYLGFAGGEK